jgi:hypothetical protein
VLSTLAILNELPDDVLELVSLTVHDLAALRQTSKDASLVQFIFDAPRICGATGVKNWPTLTARNHGPACRQFLKTHSHKFERKGVAILLLGHAD